MCFSVSKYCTLFIFMGCAMEKGSSSPQAKLECSRWQSICCIGTTGDAARVDRGEFSCTDMPNFNPFQQDGQPKQNATQAAGPAFDAFSSVSSKIFQLWVLKDLFWTSESAHRTAAAEARGEVAPIVKRAPLKAPLMSLASSLRGTGALPESR